MEPLSNTVCRQCRIRIGRTFKTSSRSFSSSTVRAVVPPESPHYVDVPSSYQPDLPYQPPAKGLLPVPRELFPARRPDKASEEYIANATKNPLPHNVVPESSLSELGKYRAAMAEVRKQHLREGLTQLHARKRADRHAATSRSAAKRAERASLIAQAEREDARLTSVSVPASMRPNQNETSAARMQADLEAAHRLHIVKMENYERTRSVKDDERADALHTLYMNARHFITSEAQLNDAINTEFAPERFATDASQVNESIWAKGPPSPIRDMVRASTGQGPLRDMLSAMMGRAAGGPSGSAGLERLAEERRAARQVGMRVDENAKARFTKDQERMKRIAEKLSGGKI